MSRHHRDPPPAPTISAACLALAAWLAAGPAAAQPPTPIEPELFAFPGSFAAPASARSASLAMADRWLGDEPFENPAAPATNQLVISPALVRVSRQDLRAGNRSYDETPAFLDGAGLAGGMSTGAWGLWAYAHQSALRLEDNAFERGPQATIPGVITSHNELRELRLGLAASHPVGPMRAGAGIEWSYRSDLYESSEASGSPDAGKRHVDFSGGAPGAQVGLRWARGDSTLGAVVVGAALRYLPALTLDGEQRLELATGDSLAGIHVDRDAGWEGGVGAMLGINPAFRLFASVGGRSAQGWESFGVSPGQSFEWKLAGEFHDWRDPWTLRFGIGQEQQSGVPEPRAGALGIGIGWTFEGTVFDLGAVRRSFRRTGEPTSFDDRLLASVRMMF
jgi:hypothetical protein